jgi:4-hydroxy-tetrahydrodipicolinate reductase
MKQAGSSLKVVQLGLGPIGIASARLALAKPDLELVGAVDLSPQLAGEDLASLIPEARGRNVTVEPDLGAALSGLKPDLVLQCTGSRLVPNLQQILTCLEHGAGIVSSMEELLYPHRRYPAETRRIDEAAKANGVAVLGTGVNPGFVMDTLALCLSGACRSVRSVYVRRVVDATRRRGPLQRKIGSGMDQATFQEQVAAGKLGHVGLVESTDLIATSLGLGHEAVDETIEPVLATEALKTEHVQVASGQVAGIHHRAWTVGRGMRGTLERVELELWMYLGAPDPADEVVLDSDPPVRCRIEGGIAGDQATAAMLINSVPRVAAAAPGLQTMATLPLVHWRG